MWNLDYKVSGEVCVKCRVLFCPLQEQSDEGGVKRTQPGD